MMKLPSCYLWLVWLFDVDSVLVLVEYGFAGVTDGDWQRDYGCMIISFDFLNFWSLCMIFVYV